MQRNEPTLPSPDLAKGQLPIDLQTPPMEARHADVLPASPGWQFEPKWDGFRCLIFKTPSYREMVAKSGKSLARFFPEMMDLISGFQPESFVVDGELLITSDGNAPPFDALQMRLHPAASRIERLARETPATLVLFDMLVGMAGETLIDAPLSGRRQELEAFHRKNSSFRQLKLSPVTHDRRVAQDWLNATGGAIDGVVCKRLNGLYEPGKRAMIKVKRLRTADCVVGGFRYLERERLVGSLLLGLYNAKGKLDHVGFTSAIANEHRAELTSRLESLIEPPGFTGKTPGGPSRWATDKSTEWEPLKPALVVEVQYDHVTGNRFRHGTKLVRWRPDKSPAQCTFEQLATETAPLFPAMFSRG